MTEKEKKELIDLVEELFLSKGRMASEKMITVWCKRLIVYELSDIKKAIEEDITAGDRFTTVADIIKRVKGIFGLSEEDIAQKKIDERSHQNYKDMVANGEFK